MKWAIIILALLVTPACRMFGDFSRGNEFTGQVKAVIHQRPILCSKYTYVDISFGVILDGRGSVSQEDVLVTIMEENRDLLPVFEEAARGAKIVRVRYDQRRLYFCRPARLARSVQILP